MATLSFNRLYISTVSSACAAVLLSACGGSGTDAEHIAQADATQHISQSAAHDDATTGAASSLDADNQATLESEIAAQLAADTADEDADDAPVSYASSVTVADPYAKGGSVEAEVWAIWDSSMRASMQKMLQDRLVSNGDVYALYDFQAQMHNLVSMARRTDRPDRLLEISRIIRIAYNRLEPSTIGTQWTCRGGTICSNYGLIGKEVRLNSAQFLGLAATVASSLASSKSPLGTEAKVFINDTARILAEHLVRWGDDAAISRLRSLVTVKASDIKSSTAAYAFTDFYLWHVTMHTNLAHLRKWQRDQGIAESAVAVNYHTRLRNHISALMELYVARVSVVKGSTGPLTNSDLAVLDRGYWRYFVDHQYAGYTGTQKPVECSTTKRTVIAVSEATRHVEATWDISHGRRLVHALDVLERHRQQLKNIYGMTDAQLGATNLPKAFAAQLLYSMWNQSTSQPLFSNFMSGANGYYQANYNSSTGACHEGYKPYTFTTVFATGGYITWARHYAPIAVLGQKLYEMSKDPVASKSEFMVSNYRNLSTSNVTKLQFLPTLVANQ